MYISEDIAAKLKNGSWIRKLFDEGRKLKSLYGEDQVFDFSLGNPIVEPSPEFKQIMARLAAQPESGAHRYIPNQGLLETREKVAEFLNKRFRQPFSADTLVMTIGAGGGMNTVLKSLLNPQDEVIILTPYFVEYDFYVQNHGGQTVHCPLADDFSIDVEQVRQSLTSRTKAIIVNTPNNPTGTLLTQDNLHELGQLLKQTEQENGQLVYILYDDPYGQLVYDAVPPNPYDSYEHTVMISSFSKDLGIAGERLGYVAIPANRPYAAEVTSAIVFSNRILGFVNAPVFMQRIIAQLPSLEVEPTEYRKLRDAMVQVLAAAGFEFPDPRGGIFIFPKTPIEDDIEFCLYAAEKYKILIVPGSGFGRKGHFRLSYSVTLDQITKSAPLFQQLMQDFS